MTPISIASAPATPGLRRAAAIVDAGVQFVTLLALSDEGAPAYDQGLAADLAALGVPSFACTPEHFPGLMAAAIRRESQARRRFDGMTDADVDVATAVGWLHAMGAAELVHGHTHRPGSEALAPGFKRHVLSDWDLDQGDRAEVLRLTRDGFERRPPASASSPS